MGVVCREGGREGGREGEGLSIGAVGLDSVSVMQILWGVFKCDL